MKFFIISFTLAALSNSLFLNWVYPYGVQGTPVPYRQLYFLYSKHQSQQTKNAFPNTFYSIQETLVGEAGKNVILISSQQYLQLLLIFEHFHYHIFESEYLGTFSGYRPLRQGNDTLLTKQCGNLNYLLNANWCDIEPFSKFKTFIETKVTAMKLQGFNLKLDNKACQ